MESRQITINSRTSDLLDYQKRSIIQVNLGKDVIDIPKDYDCYCSVFSAEILNNRRQVDDLTEQRLVLTTDPNIKINSQDNALSIVKTGAASIHVNRSINLPVGTRVSFQFSPTATDLGLTSNLNVYSIRSIAGAAQFGLTSNDGVYNGLVGFKAALPVQGVTMICGDTSTISLNVPSGSTYTPQTLANFINGKTYVFKNQGVNSNVTMACSNEPINNLLTLSVTPKNILLYSQANVPLIGLYKQQNDIASNILPLKSRPFLQQTYLLLGSSLLTFRNQPLCKIPIKASLGNYKLYSPQNPFKVKINNDLTSTFQVSLLGEDAQPINNNYADWSVTLQFHYGRKRVSL